MSLADIFTALFFLLGAGSAVLVAFHPNVLYAAVALVFSLLSVAGMYGILGADFLAGAQLIIYVGGIIVVILFAIMMSENIYRTKFLDGAQKYLIPTIVSLFMGSALVSLLFKTSWGTLNEKLERVSTLEAMGKALVGPYALVFQYVAVVLLAGLIGAVVVARPEFPHSENGGE